MALASEIIQRAYRESNLISIGATPTTNEQTEGLDLLNSLVQSTIGLEAGSELRDITVGGTYDQSSCLSPWVPRDARLALNLSAALTVSLDPNPYEGQRFAVVDVAGNFSTNNLTINGNGRTIELDTSETIDTDNFYAQWMYRGDTADWTRITDLVAADEMPLPIEFDDYFIVSLALRLNPRHGRNLTPESQAALQRSRSQIRARYRKPRQQQDMGSLGLLNQGGFTLGTDAALYGRA
jgi:hypothetical protein